MVADDDPLVSSSNSGLRPPAIRRAFEVLQKLQSYNADVVPETTSDDDDDDETQVPQTQSPMAERQEAGPPECPSSRQPTPTLDIVQDASARASPNQDPDPAPTETERAVTAATQTPQPTTTVATSTGTIEPLVVAEGAIVTSTPRQGFLPASLNQSSVGTSPETERAPTDLDDSRRVVIHSLTPPKVTTAVRTLSGSISSRGRFSQGIAPPLQPLDHDHVDDYALHESRREAGKPLPYGGPRNDPLPPPANASERIARRTASDVKEMRTSGQYAAQETERQLAMLHENKEAGRTRGTRQRHAADEHSTDNPRDATYPTPRGHQDPPRAVGSRGRSASDAVGVSAGSVDFEWLLRSANGGFLGKPRIALDDVPRDLPLPNSHPPPAPTPRRSSATHANASVGAATYASSRVASPLSEVYTSRSRIHQPQQRPAATPQTQRTPPRDLSPRVQQDTVSSRNRRKPPVQSSRSPMRASSPLAPPPPAKAHVPVSAYTRQLLREHNERRRHAQLQRAKEHQSLRQASPTTRNSIAVRGASPQNHRTSPAHIIRHLRPAAVSDGQPLRRASQQHTSRYEDPHRTPPSSIQDQQGTLPSAGAPLNWMPLPNRHATGGSASSQRRRSDYDGSGRPMDASSSRRTSANHATTTPNRPTVARRHSRGVGGDAGDDEDLDVSPISPQQHSTMSTGVDGQRVAVPASPTQPNTRQHIRGDASTQSVVQYLVSLTDGSPTYVSAEVAAMHVGSASPHGTDVSRLMCAHWVALTTLINQPVCVEELVVPLLLSELEHRIATVDPMAPSPRDGDVAHLLCAIIGLGSSARAAMDLLGEMLDNGIGDPTLVGLAIRSACGEDGVKMLCTMIGESRLPQTQCAAVSALGLMPQPQEGHTTIMCLGLPQLRGKKMFYQPKARGSKGSDHPLAGQDDDSKAYSSYHQSSAVVSALATAAHATGYRPTHVFLDAELVRRHLAQLTCSQLYAKRCGEASRIDHLTVLRDFLACVPFVFGRLQCDPNVHNHLTSLEEDMAPWLSEQSRPSGSGPGSQHNVRWGTAPVLPHDTESIWRDEPLLGRHITMTLMRVLRDDATSPAVAEQVLRTIAVLPKMVTEVLADPLVEYTASLVDSFAALLRRDERDDGTTRDDALRGTIAAAVLATGCVVNREVHAQKLIDSASAIAIHLLRGEDESLRRAACIALGTMGPISSNPQAIIKLIVDALSEGALPSKTACWALSRSGEHGAACLLDIASQTHLGRTQRIEAASALGYIVAPHRQGSTGRSMGGASSLRPSDAADLIAAVVKGLHRLVVDNMTLANGEQLAVAALRSLVELHRNAHRGSHSDRLGGAAAASFCNMILDILDTNGASSARSVVLDELFLMLCSHGGPRGLHFASEYTSGGHRPHDAPCMRAAAAFGLRGAGGLGYLAIAAALGDASPEVRAQAVDTLAAVSVPTVVACMRDAPPSVVNDVAELLSKALHFAPPAGAARGHKDVQQWLQATAHAAGPGTAEASTEGASRY